MGEEDRPGLVHRIDKNTSGILVIAKTEKSMTILAEKFADRELNRKYIALVWGDLKQNKGTITGHIGRSPKNRKVMSVFNGGEHGKHAITHYKVLERFGYTTLVECKLETGRTHQIRVHMNYIGTPILGDKSYGRSKKKFKKIDVDIEKKINNFHRQALHAKTLGFNHPKTGKKIFFKAKRPDDFDLLIKILKKSSL